MSGVSGSAGVVAVYAPVSASGATPANAAASPSVVTVRRREVPASTITRSEPSTAMVRSVNGGVANPPGAGTSPM